MAGIKKKMLILSVSAICLLIALVFIFNKKGRKDDKLPPVSDAMHPAPDTLSLPDEVFLTAYFDFEGNELLMSENSVTGEKAVSGTRSLKFIPSLEYGATYEKKMGLISGFDGLKDIQVSLKMFAEEKPEEVFLVVSVDDPAGQNVLWTGNPLNSVSGEWSDVSASFRIASGSLKKDNVLKVYVWNKSKNTFYIDDIRIEFSGTVNRFVVHSVPVPERNIHYDFEVPFEGENPESFSSEVFRSGNKSFLLSGSTSYSPSIVKRINEVIDSELKLITLSAWLFPKKDNPDMVLVVSLKDSNGKEYSWNGRSSEKGKFPANKWTKHRAQFKLPFEQIQKDDIISAYLWNKSGTDVFVDDMDVVYGETNVRSGEKPLLDMTIAGDKGYNFPDNKPPFRSAILSKVPISDYDSGFLIHTDGLQEGDINPFQPVVSGAFVKGQPGTHQLFCIQNSVAILYSYCSEINQFQKLIQTDASMLPSWVSEADIFSLDYNGDKIDEVLLVSKSGDRLLLLSVSDLTGVCKKGSAGTAAVSIIGSSDSDVKLKELTGKNLVYISGDFNNNGKSEILAVNGTTGGYRIFEFEQGEVKLIYSTGSSELFASDKKSGKISLSAFKPAKNNADLLLICYEVNGKDVIKLAGRKSASGPLTEINDHKLPVHLLNDKTHFYSGDFLSDGTTQILINNTDWRFDLKLAEFRERDMIIKYNLDFAGFSNSRNPKFYECRKIITGKFTQPEIVEVLAITRNCDDHDYNGLQCRKFSNTGIFVPAIQMFKLNVKTDQ